MVINPLSRVCIFKNTATLSFQSVPMILLPGSVLESIGFPPQDSRMFFRMLGWAYLALCVGYTVGLRAALKGAYSEGPVYVGLMSNGGACLYLAYYGFGGE
jgi:hypothetical protein